MSSLTIFKSNSGHIYVDVLKNILHLEILNEQYNKEEFTNLLHVFKTYIQQCRINKKKHYVVFHTQKIGIYPLTCYGTIKDTLEEIKPDLLKVLHSTCVIVEPNFTSQILKFFFSIYTPVRPACVIEDIKEADAYFSQEINQNTDLF